jgi:hypothetical protein
MIASRWSWSVITCILASAASAAAAAAGPAFQNPVGVQLWLTPVRSFAIRTSMVPRMVHQAPGRRGMDEALPRRGIVILQGLALIHGISTGALPVHARYQEDEDETSMVSADETLLLLPLTQPRHKD